MNKERKQRANVSIGEYLQLCQDELTKEDYLEFEENRVKKLYKITAKEWITILENQNLQCYYCKTDLRIIQQLICKGFINPRKRGSDSYSGIHFELDHKNANKDDNNLENLVASCYYCNNDKSDTFSSEIFKNYFATSRNQSFIKLLDDNKLSKTENYIHNLKWNNKLK